MNDSGAAASSCRPTANSRTGRDVAIAALLGAEEFGFFHHAFRRYAAAS